MANQYLTRRQASSRERYWTRRVLAELEKGKGEMLRNDDAVPVKPPQRGWRLIARQRIQTSTKIYNCGCEVPVEDVTRNLRSASLLCIACSQRVGTFRRTPRHAARD